MSQNKYKQAGQNVFMSSAHGLANMLAIIATFFGTPPVYSASKDWIQDFASSHYGDGYVDIATFAYGICLAATIFFISRMTISTALMSAALMLLMRFAA